MTAPILLTEKALVENPSGARAGWFAYRSFFKPFGETVEKNNTVVSWEHCRDRVQLIRQSYLERNGLYFYHRKKAGSKVIAFLHRIEKMLKIRQKSSYAVTNVPDHILWIKLSPFWLHNLVRRSFLTFALRCGQTYNASTGENFWECFEKNKYGKATEPTQSTMPAVKLFLEGHTLYSGRALHMYEGWYRLFHGKDEEKVKKILRKRKSAKTLSQGVAVY